MEWAHEKRNCSTCRSYSHGYWADQGARFVCERCSGRKPNVNDSHDD